MINLNIPIKSDELVKLSLISLDLHKKYNAAQSEENQLLEKSRVQITTRTDQAQEQLQKAAQKKLSNFHAIHDFLGLLLYILSFIVTIHYFTVSGTRGGMIFLFIIGILSLMIGWAYKVLYAICSILLMSILHAVVYTICSHLGVDGSSVWPLAIGYGISMIFTRIIPLFYSNRLTTKIAKSTANKNRQMLVEAITQDKAETDKIQSETNQRLAEVRAIKGEIGKQFSEYAELYALWNARAMELISEGKYTTSTTAEQIVETLMRSFSDKYYPDKAEIPSIFIMEHFYKYK